MIDLLSLISTLYNQRNQQQQLAQQASQFERELGFRGAESAADRGWRSGESASERALREKLQGNELGFERDKFGTSSLQDLSQLLGKGAANTPQADVLALLASKAGVNVNRSQLLNAAKIAANRSNPAGGIGGGWEIGIPNGFKTGQWEQSSTNSWRPYRPNAVVAY